jgi:succinate dehydrogenase / fumarate reductase, cytochrome b subunit
MPRNWHSPPLYAPCQCWHCACLLHLLEQDRLFEPRHSVFGLKIMAEAKGPAARPLSPHLQIYRMTLTMMMSIVHRITGAALYFGTLLLAWWLLAAASGPNAYATFQSVASSFIGRVVLFGYTWALVHHMLGGIRHLIWDTGHGFGPAEREWLARANLVGSIVLTILLWFVGGFLMGGLR